MVQPHYIGNMWLKFRAERIVSPYKKRHPDFLSSTSSAIKQFYSYANQKSKILCAQWHQTNPVHISPLNRLLLNLRPPRTSRGHWRKNTSTQILVRLFWVRGRLRKSTLQLLRRSYRRKLRRWISKETPRLSVKSFALAIEIVGFIVSIGICIVWGHSKSKGTFICGRLFLPIQICLEQNNYASTLAVGSSDAFSISSVLPWQFQLTFLGDLLVRFLVLQFRHFFRRIHLLQF